MGQSGNSACEGDVGNVLRELHDLAAVEEGDERELLVRHHLAAGVHDYAGPPHHGACIFEKCIFKKCIFEKCIFEKCIFRKFANFWRARSRLYQNEILQQNMRLTAFFKLYKICILLHRCNLKIFAKNRFEKSTIFVKNQ